MLTVKEKIINGIQNIENDELLIEVYALIKDIQNANEIIILNPEQKTAVNEARNDYKSGRIYSTDEIFKNLLDD